jgi:pimeloyl-ACP methyl ester carboxylesterase
MKAKVSSTQTKAGVILAACLLAFLSAAGAYADCPSPLPWPSCVCEPPEQGVHQDYRLICKSENFNGVMVVYAHGYIYPQEELALPLEEIQPFADVIGGLLTLGFGFATTSYSKTGYAIKDAEVDLNALVDDVQGSEPKASQVLLVGASEGGLITAMMLERDSSERYSGGLALCGPVGGMTQQLNYLGDFRVLFDYFFPSVFPVGLDDYTDDFYTTACSDSQWDDFYAGQVKTVINASPLRTLQLFKITGAAFDLFDSASFAETAQIDLKYTVCGTKDLVDTASGMPYDNMKTWYDASLLLNLRVDRVTGDPGAEAYVKNWYDTTGKLRRPLVTLHNLSDPAVPYKHEELYKQKVAAAGKLSNLTSLPALGYGHCNFKPWQVLGAFSVLLNQVHSSEP